MNRMYVIGALVVLVLALFVFQPDLLGRGGDAPQLGVIPSDDTMTVETDVECSVAQDCIDWVLDQDATATGVEAVCDGTCTFVTEKFPVEVSS